MSDEGKKDSGLVGGAAALATGAGAGYGINGYMSNRAVKNALTDKEKLGEAVATIADDGKITGGKGAISKVLAEAGDLKDTLPGKQGNIESFAKYSDTIAQSQAGLAQAVDAQKTAAVAETGAKEAKAAARNAYKGAFVEAGKPDSKTKLPASLKSTPHETKIKSSVAAYKESRKALSQKSEVLKQANSAFYKAQSEANSLLSGIVSKTKNGFTLKIGGHEFSDLKSLPEGLPVAAGKIEVGGATHPLGAEDVKKFFAEGNKANVEKFLKGQQKEVLHELRAPLGAKFFSTKHWGGKAAVVAGAVGTAYVAKVVFDGVFGSRKDGHISRVEAERAQPVAAAGVSA
jgi:hypothetical protein